MFDVVSSSILTNKYEQLNDVYVYVKESKVRKLA